MCVYLKTAPGVTNVVKSVFSLPYIGFSNYNTTWNKNKKVILRKKERKKKNKENYKDKHKR